MHKMRNTLKFILILPIFIITRPVIKFLFASWTYVTISAISVKFGSVSEFQTASLILLFELMKSFALGFLPLYFCWLIAPKYKKSVTIIFSIIEILFFIIFSFIFYYYQKNYDLVDNIIFTIAELSGVFVFWFYLKNNKLTILKI